MSTDERQGCTRPQLEAYLDRVGFEGVPAPDEDTLTQLHRGHVARIPFENLEIHFGRPMRIEPEALFEDLVARRRGGYCFQMNELLARSLLAIGFGVERFAARVWNDASIVPPLNHQLLRVTTAAGERFLADVGFGSTSPVRPLPWELERIDEQGLEAYRLEHDERFGVRLSYRAPDGNRGGIRGGIRDGSPEKAESGEGWEGQYSFADVNAHPIDFRFPNYAVSTLPDSFFVQMRVITRAEPELRQHIYAGRFTEIRSGVRSDRQVDAGEEAQLCRDLFGLELPGDLPWLT